MLPLLSRAERVIKGIPRIRWIAIDLGFMSGPLLHEIAARGYEFALLLGRRVKLSPITEKRRNLD